MSLNAVETIYFLLTPRMLRVTVEMRVETEDRLGLDCLSSKCDELRGINFVPYFNCVLQTPF